MEADYNLVYNYYTLYMYLLFDILLDWTTLCMHRSIDLQGRGVSAGH